MPDSAGERWADRHAASSRETIFALSTPPGRSAVAVIRLSGPHAGAALEVLTSKVPAARVAQYAKLIDGDGRVLDDGLVLSFPAPKSFTGEDCAEIQCHGSVASIRAILASLAQMPGLREAKPGEFTQRAFTNGKIDLARTEALADLIEAQTERQRRLALRATADGPARLAADWRDRILDALAAIDARLDFADEGDVDDLQNIALAAQLREVAEDVAGVVRRAEAAAKIRDGFVVAICGPPNAGKSTLLNALVGREQAIVSPHPGTTRDTIEVSLDLKGSLVTFIDTAGLRDTVDAVERMGVDRARMAASRADYVLWLDAPDVSAEPPRGLRIDLRVGTKSDLIEARNLASVAISAINGSGLNDLIELIAAQAIGSNDDIGDGAILRERHVATAIRLCSALCAAAAEVNRDRLELAAAQLRGALAATDALGSKSADEDVLDRIFGRFCIGK